VRPAATRSRDGTYRLDLRVPVRVSLPTVAAAVAYGLNEDAETVAGAGLGRLLRWARQGFAAAGVDGFDLDGPGDGYEDVAAAAAERLVELGVFPAP